MDGVRIPLAIRSSCRSKPSQRYTVILVRVVGANINFTEDGQFHSILDAALIRHLTDTLSAEQNLGAINYIGGGAAGFMTQ